MLRTDGDENSLINIVLLYSGGSGLRGSARQLGRIVRTSTYWPSIYVQVVEKWLEAKNAKICVDGEAS